MKRIILLLTVLVASVGVYSQSTLPLRADTVVIEKTGGNANFKLKDASRDSTGGLLTNIGNGVYRAKKTRKIGGDSIIIGIDTFQVGNGSMSGTADQIAFFNGTNSITSNYTMRRTSTADGIGLEIVNDGSDANGAVFNLYLNDLTPTTTQRLGEFHFFGNNSSIVKTQLAAIYAESDGITAGAENGIQLMNITVNGSLREYFNASKSGNNVKLRLANNALIDADNNSVNFGTAAITPATGFKYEKSANSAVDCIFSNPNAGSGSYTAVMIGTDNNVANDLRIARMGDNFPDFESFKQKGVSIEAGENLTGGLSISADNATGGDIRFYTGGYQETKRRMTIAASGNIGINTTSPVYGLHINRTIAVNKDSLPNISAFTNQVVLIADTTTGQVKRINPSALGSVITASNGLTKTGNNITPGGTVTSPFTWTLATDADRITATGTSSSIFGLINTVDSGPGGGVLSLNTNASGQAIIGINSTSGGGVYGETVGGIGTAGYDGGSGIGVVATSIGGTPIVLEGGANNTNQIQTFIKALRTNPIGVTPAAGFGSQFLFTHENDNNVNVDAGKIISVWEDPDDGNETASLDLHTINEGSISSVLKISGEGMFTTKYGVGSFTGTPDYLIGANSAGQYIEIPFSSFSQTANGQATNTTTETTIVGSGVGSLTITPSQWTIGGTWEFVIEGETNTDGSSPAQTNFKIKAGSTTLAETGNIFNGTGVTGRDFTIRGTIVCRTTGASGTVMCVGKYHDENDGIGQLNNGGTATFDMTTNQTFGVTVTMNNTGTGNIINSFNVVFRRIN